MLGVVDLSQWWSWPVGFVCQRAVWTDFKKTASVFM